MPSTYKSLIDAAASYEEARRQAVDRCNQACAIARAEYHTAIEAARKAFIDSCDAAHDDDRMPDALARLGAPK